MGKNIIVQKFGGTSVGSIERIKAVADRVARTAKSGNRVVVVASAMSGETDKLVKLVGQITESPDPREYDQIVSTGEQVSISLLALALHQAGLKARSYLGHQVPIVTDTIHSKARIVKVDPRKLVADLRKGAVPVIAGFQGVTESGEEITTLGRGGSDTTAVAVAAALKAKVCEIYTDVDGVYTTDPNLCPEARKLDRVSYDEMLEMASLGAKVMQTVSMEYAKRFMVPLHIRTSFSDEPGTLIVKEDSRMEKQAVTGITYNKNEAKIAIRRVPDRPGIAARIFGPVAEANVVVDMIVQNVSADGYTDLTFTVMKNEYKQAMDVVKKVAKDVGAGEVEGNTSIAKVSMVGLGMRSHSGVASRMFDALAKESINILMISTSEIKISVVVDEKFGQPAVRTLHRAFNLHEKPKEE
ncbi:MAG: aspartate kinase [Nitrospirae bacterium]|nr:aspartate kinase [Nitrospirota bacterium]